MYGKKRKVEIYLCGVGIVGTFCSELGNERFFHFWNWTGQFAIFIVDDLSVTVPVSAFVTVLRFGLFFH